MTRLKICQACQFSVVGVSEDDKVVPPLPEALKLVHFLHPGVGDPLEDEQGGELPFRQDHPDRLVVVGGVVVVVELGGGLVLHQDYPKSGFLTALLSNTPHSSRMEHALGCGGMCACWKRKAVLRNGPTADGQRKWGRNQRMLQCQLHKNVCRLEIVQEHSTRLGQCK